MLKNRNPMFHYSYFHWRNHITPLCLDVSSENGRVISVYKTLKYSGRLQCLESLRIIEKKQLVSS